MENPLHGVLVVGSSEDLLNNQLSCTGHNGRVVSEVGVLEKDAIVLLVDADGVLDLPDATGLGGHEGIEVVDGSLAVTAKSETVGQVTSTVLSEIEGVLALVRVLGVAVGDNHLG